MDEIRRFVQIDDYKRALYMAAREELQRDFSRSGLAFVCVKLRSKMAEESFPMDLTRGDFFRSIEKDFNDLFPEIIELFDGRAYRVDGKWASAHVGDAWFGVEMIEARIALIDFILTQ